MGFSWWLHIKNICTCTLVLCTYRQLELDRFLREGVLIENCIHLPLSLTAHCVYIMINYSTVSVGFIYIKFPLYTANI